MRDFQKQSDPVHNGQFRRRWQPVCQPSAAELLLAELRNEFGPIEGTRRFAKEWRKLKAWGSI